MNLSEMMTRAHAWTRETVAAYPGISYRGTLAEALREVWKDQRTESARALAAVRLTIAALLQHAEDVTAARTPAPAAAADTEAARRAQEARQAAEEAAQEDAARQQAAQQQPQTLGEFFKAPGELQLDMIRRLATRCPDRAMNRTRPAVDPETGERLYNKDGEQMREFIRQTWAAWMTPRKRGGLGLVPFAEAVEEVTAEAWMILQRINPAAQEAVDGIEWGRKKPLKVKDGEPLGLTLARACDLACYHLDRQHRDRPGFYAADPASLDDPDFSLAAHLPSPEPVTLNRAEIESCARSPEDLFTVKMLATGYNHLEIAGGIKPSPAAARTARAAAAAQQAAAADPDNAEAQQAAQDAAQAAETAAKADRKQLEAVAAVMDLDPQQMRRGLGVSRQAVEKRLEKMARRRSTEARNIEAWLSGDDLKRPEPQPRPRTWTQDNASTGSSTGSSAAAAALYTAAAAAPEDPEDAARRRADIAAMAAANAAALAETARRRADIAESADEKEEARAACAALADDARRAACAAVIMSGAAKDAYITDAARRACAAAARASNSARLAAAASRLAALDNALSR